MKEIEELEQLIKEIDAKLEDPQIASDYEKLNELCVQRDAVSARLSQAEDEFLETEIM